MQPAEDLPNPSGNVSKSLSQSTPNLPDSPGANASPVRLPLRDKRVVICEDEGITQMQLRRALLRAGLEVVGTAINGRDGVEVALRERPDLVLMDIRMPIMDGLEAAKRILAEYAVCLVMLTAFADKEMQEQAEQLGASGYIIKPVSSDMLLPQLEVAYAAFQSRSGSG